MSNNLQSSSRPAVAWIGLRHHGLTHVGEPAQGRLRRSRASPWSRTSWTASPRPAARPQSIAEAVTRRRRHRHHGSGAPRRSGGHRLRSRRHPGERRRVRPDRRHVVDHPRRPRSTWPKNAKREGISRHRRAPSPAARPAPSRPCCPSWSAAGRPTSTRPSRSWDALGKTIVLCGPHGSGQTVKAANQLIVAVNIQACAEAVVFLEKSGVDLKAALDVLNGGLAGSTVLTRKKDNFLNPRLRAGLPHRPAPQGHGHRHRRRPQRRRGPAGRRRGRPAGRLCPRAQGDGGLDHSGPCSARSSASGNQVA